MKRTKWFILSVGLLLFTHLSFAQTICTPNFYDANEHSSLSEKGQQIDNYFNMMNASLQSLAQNGGEDQSQTYSATIHAVYDNNNSIDNNGIISQDPMIPQSYHMNVNGISSAYKCIRAIEKWMNEHATNDADIHVNRNSDGSVTVTWG